jgi:hypothetical protein
MSYTHMKHGFLSYRGGPNLFVLAAMPYNIGLRSDTLARSLQRIQTPAQQFLFRKFSVALPSTGDVPRWTTAYDLRSLVKRWLDENGVAWSLDLIDPNRTSYPNIYFDNQDDLLSFVDYCTTALDVLRHHTDRRE